MRTSNHRSATPLLTKLDLALTAAAIVVTALFFAVPATSPNESLAPPAAVVVWACIMLTPILALIARLTDPRAQHRLTYATVPLWLEVLALGVITGV